MPKKGWWASLSEERKREIYDKRNEKTRALKGALGFNGRKNVYPETLCWDCQRAVKQCPWSARFQPVPGWDAEPTRIATAFGTIPSFHVKSCPMHVPDPEGSNEEEDDGEEIEEG